MIQSVVAPKPAFALSIPTPTSPTPATPTLINVSPDDLKVRVGLNFDKGNLYGRFGGGVKTPFGDLGLDLQMGTGGDLTGVASLSNGPVTGIVRADANGNYSGEVKAIYQGSFQFRGITVGDPSVSIQVDNMNIKEFRGTAAFQVQLPPIYPMTLNGRPFTLPPLSFGVVYHGNQLQPAISFGRSFALN